MLARKVFARSVNGPARKTSLPSLRNATMQAEIIKVTRETSSRLSRIAVDVFDAEPTPAYLDVYLTIPTHALFIAIADDMVVGQVRGALHYQPDKPVELYIDNLGVTPDLKRRGIGARLVKALLAWGQEHDCKSAWLATETDNDEARAFYDAFGFDSASVAYYFTEHPESG